MRLFVAIFLLLGAPALAQLSGATYITPQRGDPDRAQLMDALRPHAEWMLGAPVEFVIIDLRVAGDVAFASVVAQRPGGGEISLYETPAYERGSMDPEMSDGSTLQALYMRSGATWVAVHHAIGATDVWYAWDGFCPIWSAVLPETCR